MPFVQLKRPEFREKLLISSNCFYALRFGEIEWQVLVYTADRERRMCVQAAAIGETA